MGSTHYGRQAYSLGGLGVADERLNNSPMEWNAAIGAAIRSERKRQKMTQEQFAERAGLRQGSVSKIETGEQGLSFESLARVAGALKLSASALLAAAEGVPAPVKVPQAPEMASTDKLINRIEGDVDEMRVSLMHFMRVLCSRLPGSAAEIEAELLAETTPGYAERGGRALWLQVLGSAREAEAGAQHASQPPAVSARSRRTARA